MGSRPPGSARRHAARALILALLWVGGCAGGGWSQLAGGDYVFPPKKIVKGAVVAKVTGGAADILADSIEQLLPTLLPTNEAGWVCLNVDAFVDAGVVSLPLSLGPFVADIGVRQLNVCLDLESLAVDFVEGSDPAELSLTVTHARVSLESAAVVFGAVDLVLIQSDAACLVDDDLGLDDVPHFADVSFSVTAVLDVDEDGAFSMATDITSLEIHDVGVTVMEDCSLPECSDENPGNIGSPCLECGICNPADFGADIFELFQELLGGLLDPVIAEILDAVSKPLLDELLNGRPLDVSAGVALGNVLGALTASARSANVLGVLLRPAPGGLSVSGLQTLSGLDLRMEGGTAAAKVHACVGDVGPEPVFEPGPYPDLTGMTPDGAAYEIAIAISQAFLNQAMWSVYETGGLCLALTTREVADLTGGALELTAGAVDLLVPGLAGLAGRTASIRLVILPTLSAADMPLLRVTHGESVLSLSLPDLEIGLEAFVDDDYLRVLTLSSSALIRLGLTTRDDGTFELLVHDVALGPVVASDLEAFQAARLDDIVALAVEVVLQVLDGILPLALPFDPGEIESLFGALPVKIGLLGVGATGVAGDWLAAYLTLEPAGAAKPGASAPLSGLIVERTGSDTVRVAGLGGAPSAEVRVDGLSWRPLVAGIIRHPALRLPGEHRLEVRAHGATARLRLPAAAWPDSTAPPTAPGASPSSAGCAATSGPAGMGTGALILLGLCLIGAGLARRRRRWISRRMGLGALLVALVAGCSDTAEPVARCDARSDCPLGYTCDPPLGLCVPERECSSDVECCPSTSCLNGTCRLLRHCQTDSACAADDTVCRDGACAPAGCVSDTDCTGVGRCLAGYCVSGLPCGGCPVGQVCEPATGRCLSMSPSCAAASCAPGDVLLVDNAAALGGVACDVADATCGCARLPALDPLVPGPWPSLVSVQGGLLLLARDHRYGDLIAAAVDPVAGVIGPARVVAGAPAGPIVADPAGPRGGVIAPGPDVGRFTAVAPVGGGAAILTHDATLGVLRLLRVDAAGAVLADYTLDEDVVSGLGGDLIVDPGGSLHAIWFAVTGEGTEWLRHAYTGPATEALEPGAWVRETVEFGPKAPSFQDPCGTDCVGLEVCVAGDAGPACATPDLLEACESGCPRSQLCVAGACVTRLRRAAGVLAWRDEPGSEASVAVLGSTVLAAWYDRPAGALRMALGEAGQGFGTSTRLDGGAGADVGRHVTLAVGPSAEVAILYQDADAQVLRALYGDSPLSLVPMVVEPGGKGIDAVFRADGDLVVAHGTARGDRVRILMGPPGALQAWDALAGGGIGRFNTLSVGGDGLLHLATVRDRLDPRLVLVPEVVLVPVIEGP